MTLGGKRVLKLTAVMALLGLCVALTLQVMWRAINFEYLRVSDPISNGLSGLTLLLCPPSFVMMEVGPREPITGELAALYAEVILANGVLYGTVTLALLGIVKLSDRTPSERT